MQCHTPKNPTEQWVQEFIAPHLAQSSGYKLSSYPDLIKLDQNEVPFDWPETVKESVLEKLKSKSWNRYPPSYQKELEAIIAKEFNIHHQSSDDDHVLLAPGSNLLISVLIDTFCCHNTKGQIWVLQPSFPLYEERLTYAHIPYIPWNFQSDGTFDIQALNTLQKNSVIIFASPNNPTGAVLKQKDFKNLLEHHPDCLFLADEAYFEFCDENYLDLLNDHHNLILIRTFSKTAGSAGLRLGYALGPTALIRQARKTMLPFLINPFTFEAAKAAFCDPLMKEHLKQSILYLKKERKFFLDSLSHIKDFKIEPSGGNFFLIRWPSDEKKTVVYHKLIKHGVLVRDVSKGIGLSGCLRVSLGQHDENKKLIEGLLS